MDASERAERLEDKARFDRWVAGLGGERYGALYREALEFAGPDGCFDYLDMARRIDEDHQALKRERAAARVRAAVARRRIELAASAALERATEIQLAADDLLSDPRLAGEPDFGTRPERSRAEVEAALRFAMGLANRAPTEYQRMLPPVGDLARLLGVKS